MYVIIGGDGKEYGPISGDDLRKWIAEGRLDAQSKVKAESDAEFRELSTFPEFADVFARGSGPGVPPPLSGGGDRARASVLQRVQVPAVGLMATAILDLAFGLWGLFRAIFPPNLEEANATIQQLNNPQLEEFFQKWMHLAYGPFGIISGLVGLVLAVLIFMGGLKMKSLRSYEFSVTASILAMLPCVTPCCLVGLPIGIWALVVLLSAEVKSQFH